MKRLLAAILLLLASALCLAACAPADGDTRAAVSDATDTPYREEKIRLPDDMTNVLDVRENDQGELLAAASSDSRGLRVVVFRRVGDGSWEEAFSTDELAASLGGEMRLVACLTPEGKLLCVAKPMEGSDVRCYLVEEGSFAEAPLPSGDDVSRLRVADDGSVFIVGSYSDGFARYDLASGEKMCSVQMGEGEFFSDFALHEGLVYVATTHASGMQQEYSIAAFDPGTGEEAKIDPGMQAALNATLPPAGEPGGTASPPTLASASDGLYVCAKGSVFRCTPEGAERVLSGAGTHLENVNQNPTSLIVLGGGGFVIRYFDRADLANTLAYRYVEGEAAEPTAALTVYALEQSAGIQQAVATFRDERPDVAVELQVGIPDGSGLSVDDAVRALNAELLAGTGPDVLVLDGLPLRQLADQGMLLDVSDVLDEATARDEVFQNVLAAFDDDAGCFALPTRFTTPVALGGVDVLSHLGTLDELTSYLDSSDETRAALSPSLSLASLYAASYPGLAGDAGSVSTEALTSFFEDAKRILKIGEANMPEIPDQPEGIPAYDFLGSKVGAIADGMGEVGRFSGGTGLLASDARFTVGSVSDPLDLGGISIVEKYAEYPCDLAPVVFDGVRVFEPRIVLGVSVRAAQAEEAKEFILHALAKSQQAQRIDAGLPVSAAALKEGLLASGGYSISFMGGSDEQTFERGPYDESEIAEYAELLEGATVPVVHDKVIDDAVSEALLAYCRDETSLEDAVATALQKITLYQAQ